MAFNNVPVNGWPQIKDLERLDALAKQIEDMPVYTSDDRAFLDTWERDLPVLAQDVSDLQTTKANQITIAPTFNAETAYDPGDIVYYNGLSYRCVNAHEGEWDADDFAATTINNELSALNSKLTGLVKSSGITGTTDAVGDFSFDLPSDGSILLQIRPLRDPDHYNVWWGAIAGSRGANTGYSLKAIKDDGTALGTQAIKFEVYYI